MTIVAGPIQNFLPVSQPSERPFGVRRFSPDGDACPCPRVTCHAVEQNVSREHAWEIAKRNHGLTGRPTVVYELRLLRQRLWWFPVHALGEVTLATLDEAQSAAQRFTRKQQETA